VISKRVGFPRWRWWMFVPILLLLVISAGYGVTRSALLDIDRIEIVGADQRVSEATVVEISGIAIGQPLIDLNLSAVETRLFSIPWVSEARVSRDWPGTVHLRIFLRTAHAIGVDPSGSQALLDQEGVVLEKVERSISTNTALPRIRVDAFGVPGTRVSGIDPLLRAASAIPSDLAAWIVALAPIGEGVRAELVGGAEANLGFSDDYHEQARALSTVLTRVTLTCLREVDVSVPSNPVVRRSNC